MLYVLVNAVTQYDKIIHKNIGKQVIMAYIFTDNVLLYLESPEDSL